MTNVCGADNGYSGWLVFLDVDTARIIDIQNCATNAKQTYQLLSTYEPAYAAIEEVFMSPGFRGVASAGFIVQGRYMQTFELLDIPYESIRAVSWRKFLGIKARGREEQKKAAIEHCQHIFHADDQEKLKSVWQHIVDHHRVKDLVYDNNKCESALIAYYALQKYRDILNRI